MSVDEVRTAKPQQGSTLDYPFKLLAPQSEVPVIPATVSTSDGELDESDFRVFETSYDYANEETFTEHTPKNTASSDSEEKDVTGDAVICESKQ